MFSSYVVILAILTLNVSAKDYPSPSYHQNVFLRLVSYSGPLDEEALNWNFSEVETLEIRLSNITSFSNDILKKFKNLDHLSITFSEIHKTEDEVFKNCCPKLRKLEIRRWEGFNPQDLRGIGTLPLEELEIMDQNIPTLKNEMFENTELKELRLINDRIETIDPSAFKKLINLEYLLISENRLKSFPKEALVPLRKLVSLEFSTNRLETLTTEDIPELPRLKKLTLTNEKLREVNFTDIASKTPRLQEINLIGNVGVKIYGNSSIVHNF